MSHRFTSLGAPLMMQPPLRLGKLCRSPDRSVASEDGGAGPCGRLAAYWLSSVGATIHPACFYKNREEV